MLISPERHYIFYASKTTASVISNPLAVMELFCLAVFLKLIEARDGHHLQKHFTIAACPDFCAAFLIPSQPKIQQSLPLHSTMFLFLHGSHLNVSNKGCALTVQIGASQLPPFLQCACFAPKQSSWPVKTSHYPTWPAM